MNLDEEAKLYTTNQEREQVENLATLYSIIVSLDYLERAYVRDSVTSKDYAPACTRLLAQYKSLMKLVGEDIGGVEAFMKRYRAFITFMDALKLNLRAKDQLHPLLTEVMAGYAKFKDSAQWEGRAKIIHWLITLNAMKAADEITEDQSRQMLFDIENAYNEFFRSLSGK
ncbi:vacuolar protein sorting-associated protein 28 [Trichosporon asahii var. asahii CBS 8904]|uniref:Vacuolar protein sorting-associated protein 28 n=2 Tax=Trichosporon asahii var. asahii TaxID=189963 RepID=K1W0M9_TRIAC|nr:vacuolar protein sorting-associated protein 28 [Trichosporon asahii var. asahii CBS 2479]EJT51260.1 vacuolar protein sorting-associated protein 28 [Trichosporon asahii var. asahii CBS 2479]EKD05377.1 vacuolar protein sorting-associated protein 28 [Trichosporon asahii var. asahii CBS 8904]